MRAHSHRTGRKSVAPIIPVLRPDKDRTSTVPQIYVESESTPDLTHIPTTPVRQRRKSMSGSPRSPVQRVSFDDNLQVVPLSPISAVSPLSSPVESGAANRDSFSLWRSREGPTFDQYPASSSRLRSESRVSTQDVLEAFQGSSWGDAMRRSVSAARRRSGEQPGAPRFSFTNDP